MPGTDFDERRKCGNAGWNPVWAARFEGASVGQLGDRRNGAFNGRQGYRAISRQSWDGPKQALCIRMSGCAEDVGLGAQFD